jgi:signal transduction histidine kinase
VRTDRIKLGRVLSNIVGNAIKYTRVGSVAISASVTSDRVSISIRDSGVGITPAHLDSIFDEFTQVQDGNRGYGDGWGLGLAICGRLMVALGGRITVASEPGCGSTFTVSLPAAAVSPSKTS